MISSYLNLVVLTPSFSFSANAFWISVLSCQIVSMYSGLALLLGSVFDLSLTGTLYIAIEWSPSSLCSSYCSPSFYHFLSAIRTNQCHWIWLGLGLAQNLSRLFHVFLRDSSCSSTSLDSLSLSQSQQRYSSPTRIGSLLCLLQGSNSIMANSGIRG